jgi:hypothetical protein
MSFVGEKIKKGTDGWMGNALSIGGRVTKIDACLSNSVIYQMSLRLLHKSNIDQMENLSGLSCGLVVDIIENTPCFLENHLQTQDQRWVRDQELD